MTTRYRPIDFLKDFNIVDTPGTNTIVANHQEITENFVPMADLIVFVFSVTNPWGGSAWDFLRLIGHEWKKNIVFVVQQADLRDPRRGRRHRQTSRSDDFANFRSELSNFCGVSKKGLPGKNHTGLPMQTSYGAKATSVQLEDWITKTVSHSEQRGGKLRSVAQTAQVVAGGLRARLQGSLDILKSDQEKLASIRGIFQSRKEQTQRQVGGFIREIEQAYDACRERGEKVLEERLTVGQTLKMIFSGGRWEKGLPGSCGN